MFRSIAATFAASLVLVACSSSGGTGEIAVRLTDAPGPYDAVEVQITAVSAHRADAADGPESPNAKDDASWVTIAVPTQTIDLLKLQNGVDLALGNATVPAGSYDMLRLVVSSATVTVGGATQSLKIPSGSERGIQIKYAFTVAPNDHAQLLLDFDANASVHEDGNGGYLMNPVLSVKSESHG